jgi:TPR repeat protein
MIAMISKIKIKALLVLILSFVLAGCAVNYSEIKISKLRQMAESGDTEAQVNYGNALFFGDGVPASKDEAFKYYMMAAKAGNRVAQYYVGNAYYTGIGAEHNLQESKRWYHTAADNGYAPAYSALAKVIYRTAESEQQICEVFYWYRKAELADVNSIPSHYFDMKKKLIKLCGDVEENER